MNEAALANSDSSIAALPAEDQRLIVASARVVSLAHCAFLLANGAVTRCKANQVDIAVSLPSSSSSTTDDQQQPQLTVEDNGHFSKTFIDSLRAAFRQRVFARLARDLDLELEASFPALKHALCLARSAKITWPIDATKSFVLTFEQGCLTSFELVPLSSSSSATSPINSISLSGLFWNVPVRIRAMNAAEEMRCLAQTLEHLAISHFIVRFSLRSFSPDHRHSHQNALCFGPFQSRFDAFLSLRSLLDRGNFTPMRFMAASAARKDYSLNGHVALKKLSEPCLHAPKLLFINKLPVSPSSSGLYSLVDQYLSRFYLNSSNQQQRTFSCLVSFQLPQHELLHCDWHESAFNVQLKNATAFRRFLKSSLSSFVEKCREETQIESTPIIVIKPSTIRSSLPFRVKKSPEEEEEEEEHDDDSEKTRSSMSSSNDSFSDSQSNKSPTRLPLFFKAPPLPIPSTMVSCHGFDWSVSRDDLCRLRLVGQFCDTVIVCHSPEAAVLVGIDQHAAHERIRLDRLLGHHRRPKSVPVNSGGCHHHHQLPLKPSDVFAFDVIKWERLGFLVTRNGDTASVDAIPDLFIDIFDGDDVANQKMQMMSLVSQTVSHILSNPSLCHQLLDIPCVIEAAKASSCHGAVKASTKLSRDQCQGILDALTKCHDPFHCAHGRPTVVPIVKLPSVSAQMEIST